MSQKTFHIVGAGAFGSSLARLWARAGKDVRLWCRDPEQALALERTQRNPKIDDCPHLGPVSARVLGDGFSVAAEDLVFMAVKARAQAEVFQDLAQHLHHGQRVVTLAKGFADDKGSLLTDRFGSEVESFALSGPSFAADLFLDRPTALTLAGKTSADLASDLQVEGKLRIYSNPDLSGVQICGAVKNIIALACGCSDGLGLGASARAALIARGLNEMSVVVAALGGDPKTVLGLAGVGDLALTCQDSKSRNYAFGVKLGQDMNLRARREPKATVEGVGTVLALVKSQWSQDLHLPISRAVAAVVQGEEAPGEAVSRLLAAPVGSDRPAFTI